MSLPLIMIFISGLVLLAFGAFSVYQVIARKRDESSTKNRRLIVEDYPQRNSDRNDNGAPSQAKPTAENVAAKKALELTTGGDFTKVARIRALHIQAGDFDPSSVAKFVLRRILFLFLGALAGVAYTLYSGISLATINGLLYVAGAAAVGFYLPLLRLKSKIKDRTEEYRNGFPDFLDLMIVCADAGLSLDASIDRVSRELSTTYPNLSHNLMTFSLELRAGRTLGDAMASFGERVPLPEVGAFAVLLKQSRELGTSLSSTLHVFSDEMRDKRMMKAEEKAHALPAKMTIPVTMCILPVVLMIAIIPSVVRLMGM